MPLARLVILTLLALAAFASNSLLCRAALAHTSIDAASFTTLRMLSGAVMLWLLVRLRNGQQVGQGNWLSALALLVYAVGFSFSYRQLPAAAGALILFGAVQTTMIAYAHWRNERLALSQLAGLLLAGGGLISLLLPGLSAPPLAGALLMLGAGIAWGVYTIRGKHSGDPLKVTAGNFMRTVPMAVGLSLLFIGEARFDAAGYTYAILSGALASGIGYAIWYSALPFLKSSTAASVQLSVPVIAALGGILFLDEVLTLRLFAATIAILGGIALVLLTARR